MKRDVHSVERQCQGSCHRYGSHVWKLVSLSLEDVYTYMTNLTSRYRRSGGLISTWSALPSDAPWYNILSGLNLACTALQMITWAGILIYMKRDNRARDRGKYDHYMDDYAPEDQWKLGTKQPGFRWME